MEKPIIRIEIDGFADDAFEVVEFSGTEALSTLFEYRVTLSSADPVQDFDALLEAKAHLILGEPPVHIRGVLTSVEQSYQAAWKTESGTRTRFDVVLMPEASVMMLTHKTRVYQEKSIPEVVKDLIKENNLPGDGIDWKVGGREKKEFILQYQETDFDFMSRLLEHEGIHYHFEHGDETEVMVFGDANAAFQPISGEPEVRLGIPDPSLGIPGLGPWGYEQTNTKFQSRQRVVTKKVVLKDYNYRTPSLNLKVEGEIKDTRASMGTRYDFADNYLKPGDGNKLRDLRKEEILAGKRVFMGAGTVRRLYPGGKFKLVAMQDIDPNLEQEYVVTQFESRGSQPLAHSIEGQQYEYENTFTCIPESIVFRPERRAKWPEMPGLVHAKVCAPAGGGKYAHIDEKGRYKVQFLFDLEGKDDEKSSCYLRLAENYVGAGFGVHFPLLKDWEVLVAFEYGDPDRPVIVGAVYNQEFESPVTSGNHAQSVWRSSGQNEIRFDDTEGSEHIYVHGTRDWQIKIDHDKEQIVGQDEKLEIVRNRTKTIGQDSSETISNNKTTSVGGNHAESISGNQAITIGASKTEDVASASTESVGAAKAVTVAGAYQVSVGAAMNETVGAARASEVGGPNTQMIGGNNTQQIGGTSKITVKKDFGMETDANYSLQAKKKMVIDGGDEIILKSGSASITLKKDGSIIIDGKDVTLKASGAISAKASKDVTFKGSKVLQN